MFVTYKKVQVKLNMKSHNFTCNVLLNMSMLNVHICTGTSNVESINVQLDILNCNVQVQRLLPLCVLN